MKNLIINDAQKPLFNTFLQLSLKKVNYQKTGRVRSKDKEVDVREQWSAICGL